VLIERGWCQGHGADERGGPIGQMGTSDTIFLALESADGGANGVLMIQQKHFESARATHAHEPDDQVPGPHDRAHV
jgi:hypothetical protein